MTRQQVLRRTILLGLTLLGAGALPSGAAAGDTVADRVLGQANLRTSGPYFVDGRAFGAGAVAFDRSAVPNRVYVADAELNRVLGWKDERAFLRGQAADLVLGQPDLTTADVSGLNLNPTAACRAADATRFCSPGSLAVDRAGNVYVTDLGNYRVLEFDRPFEQDARADRVFGQPDLTSRLSFDAGGLGYPEIALGPGGELYLLERVGRERLLAYPTPLRRGPRTELVLEGASDDACVSLAEGDHLCAPLGLTVDAAGSVYVLDINPFSIAPSNYEQARLLVFRRPIASGLRAAFEVSFDSGPSQPQGGLTFDSAGDLLFAGAVCVERFKGPITAGSVPECAISRTDRYTQARLAVDADGRLFLAQFFAPGDLQQNLLLKYEPPFTVARLPQVVTSQRRTPRTLRLPIAVAVDTSSTPNHLYVADLYQRVLAWRDAAGFADGAPADLVIGGGRGAHPIEGKGGCGPAAADRLCFGVSYSGAGLAVDARGNLWVSDAVNNRVLEFDRPFEEDGVADRVIGQAGSFTASTCNQGGRSAASLCSPGALAFDRQGNLYVSDVQNFRVLLFRQPLHGDPGAPVADRVFGRPDFTTSHFGSGCAPATARNLCLGEVNENHGGINFPADGLAVDDRGHLYVVDGGNSRVLIFDHPADSDRPDPAADRVLGQDGSFTAARFGTSARSFSLPTGLALGPGGELYVADFYNSRVLEFDHPLTSDVADRVFGQRDFTSGVNMAASAAPASLQLPRAVAVDGDGDLLVADTLHYRLVAYDQP